MSTLHWQFSRVRIPSIPILSILLIVYIWIPFKSLAQTVTDYDGNVYETIAIGDQIWMAENLKSLHASDGAEISEVWSYNDDTANVDLFGRLYSWEAAMHGESASNEVPSGVQGICPAGWHLPSKAEWLILAFYLGRQDGIAGGKMKSTGTDFWQEPNTGATNESGFTALPAPWRDHYGDYSPLGFNTIFHASSVKTFDEMDYADYVILYHDQSTCGFGGTPDHRGFSIRCLKNSSTAVSNIPISDKIRIFPNPFIDRTTIQFVNPRDGKYQIFLRDLTGKTIKIIKNLSGNEYRLERDNLPAGTYVLEIRREDCYREKIIIQ